MKQVFLFSADLNKINIDNDKNVDKDDLESIIYVKIVAWYNKFEKRKALNKDTSKELMPGD